MKKVLLVLVLVMAVLVANAQATRAIVKVEDLQKTVVDNIKTDYVGYTVKDATKVTLNNVVTYEVTAVKGDLNEILVYDKDGKFIEKRAKTDMPAKTTAPASAPTNAPTNAPREEMPTVKPVME